MIGKNKIYIQKMNLKSLLLVWFKNQKEMIKRNIRGILQKSISDVQGSGICLSFGR